MKKGGRFWEPGSPWRSLLFIAGVLFLVSALFWFNSNEVDLVDGINYTQLMTAVKQGQIKSVSVSENQIVGRYHNGKGFKTQVASGTKLAKMFGDAGIEVTIEDEKEAASWMGRLALLLLTLLVLGVLAFLFGIFRVVNGGGSGGQGGGARLFGGSRNRARFFAVGQVKTKMADVAGCDEVKAELMDIVEFLKHPEKFKNIGARVPRGVLLSGAPGNGKTLLAKAMAGEANCPFFSISGSDFVEVFVGVGASRVRDLFQQARKHAPCLVFIDEIDAIGRKRSTGIGGGNDERDQTLNQLLTEMDGFSTSPGEVIIIAATNREDMLDSALLRPGRFDRSVHVPLPDIRTREQILRIHAKAVKLSSEVNFNLLARGTPGTSGADLANLINEAALIAVKLGRQEVVMEDLSQARDKLFLGTPNSSMIRTPEELRDTAFHEAGHALLRMLLPDGDPLHKVTIVARGHALGLTAWLPEQDTHVHGREYYKAHIVSALGGLLAERLANRDQSSGVSSDLQKANSMARSMVVHWGMSELGPIFVDESNNYKDSCSPDLAAQIDKEVSRIIMEAYAKGQALLEANRDKLNLLAETLLQRETMEAEEIYKLLDLSPRESHKLYAAPAPSVEPITVVVQDEGVKP